MDAQDFIYINNTLNECKGLIVQLVALELQNKPISVVELKDKINTCYQRINQSIKTMDVCVKSRFMDP